MKSFIIVGIINGTVYGLLGLGLVLVYKGARVFNFAQGEFGTVATFLMWEMVERKHWPYAVGALAAIALVGALGFLVERLVVRPLFNAPRVTILVATAGVALAAIQLQLIIVGFNPQHMGPAVRGFGITLFGVVLQPQQLLLIAVLAGLGIGMAYFFTRTDLGLAVLATSQEPVATELAGIGTKRMSSFIWTMAAVLGGIAGVLVAPTNASFTPAFMTTGFLLPSFTAAIIGGITSLSGAFLGGVVIGVAQSLGGFYLQNVIPAAPTVVVFVVLVGILLIRPQGLLGSEA